ncbi:MAG: hypothetical protein IT288_14950 [Bdellovibrionales bacterium]|nr:hypothetical protein [Bdellovibrionales bacterium]
MMVDRTLAKRIGKIILSGWLMASAPGATYAESSADSLADHLQKTQQVFKSHSTNRTLFEELFKTPLLSQKDREWYLKTYQEILDQAPPAVVVDSTSLTFKGTEGQADVKIEVVDATRGMFKIVGYDAEFDFEKKGLKHHVQYVEKILRKQAKAKKNAAHSIYDLLIPETQALSWPLFVGVGVVGAAYYIYQWSNSSLSNLSNVSKINSVTEASLSCTGTPQAEGVCVDSTGTRAFEATVVRNGKVERYYICSRRAEESKMAGSFVRIADDDGDQTAERYNFTDATQNTSEPPHKLAADEATRIRAVVAAIANCCQSKKSECSEYITKRLPLRDHTRKNADQLSGSAR